MGKWQPSNAPTACGKSQTAPNSLIRSPIDCAEGIFTQSGSSLVTTASQNSRQRVFPVDRPIPKRLAMDLGRRAQFVHAHRHSFLNRDSGAHDSVLSLQKWSTRFHDVTERSRRNPE